MKRPVMIVALLSASTVFAQEETNELPPPPPELPPILVAPAYPQPAAVPVLEQTQALEESGHQKKTVGAVLQTTGGVIAFTGAVLLVAASWSDDGACSRNDQRVWVVESQTSRSSAGSRAPPGCGDATLELAGGITLVLGVVMILPGVAVSQIGVGELSRARQLRRNHGLEWSLRPGVGAHGGHAELAMRF